MSYDTIRGYRRTDSGTLEIVNVTRIDGKPVDSCGVPLRSDGELVRLEGWPDTRVESYNGGQLLVSAVPGRAG